MIEVIIFGILAAACMLAVIKIVCDEDQIERSGLFINRKP